MLDDQQGPPTHVLRSLPVFPLPNAVLLPGMVLPLNVFEPRYLDLVDYALGAGGHIGVPLLRPGFEDDYAGRPAIEQIFGVGRLMSHQRLDDGRRFIRLEGVARVRAVEEHPPDVTFRMLACELLGDEPASDDVSLEVLKAQLERIAETLPVDDKHLVLSVLRIPDARALSYATAAIMPTLGVLPETKVDGRSTLLQLQQDCLAAETTDDRIETLLGSAASICTVLSDTGRFPRSLVN